MACDSSISYTAITRANYNEMMVNICINLNTSVCASTSDAFRNWLLQIRLIPRNIFSFNDCEKYPEPGVSHTSTFSIDNIFHLLISVWSSINYYVKKCVQLANAIWIDGEWNNWFGLLFAQYARYVDCQPIAEIVTVHRSISHKQTYIQNNTVQYEETIHSYAAERSVLKPKEIKSTKYILIQSTQ